MDYLRYTAEDFAADEDFLTWVKSPTRESNEFWNVWIAKNAQKRAEIERARQIVLALEIKYNGPPEGSLLRVWANITANTRLYVPEQEDHVGIERAPIKRKKARAWRAIAAAVVLLVMGAVYLFVRSHDHVTIATRYGESRVLILPDDSKVTLNGNSSIKYKFDAFDGGMREIWLDGEAFFSVSRTLDKRLFVVHTNELQVKVLGTRFNVSSRRGSTEVVLNDGKVELEMQGAVPLIMNPGELVAYSPGKGLMVQKPVDSEARSSWRNNRLTFNGTSLEEIALLLEDTYGYEVTFKDDQLKEKSFTGSSSSEDIQELLDKLTEVFSLEISRTQNQIIIQEKY